MPSVIEEFNELLLNGNQDTINKFFLSKCISGTLEEIRYMVENGANPRIHDDKAFINSCGIKQEIMLYYLNECGANINAQNSEALRTAIWTNNISNIKLLINNGIIITDKILWIF